MNLKRGKNIPTENLVTKRYISKFGYFVSFSASYTFFARGEFLKKTDSIIKDLQSM